MNDFWKNLTWNCEICGKKRPDKMIAVITYHLRNESSCFQRNLKYCKDKFLYIHALS